MAIRSAHEIKTQAQEVLDLIENNRLEDQFGFELGIAQEVLDQIGMDNSRAQREYLNDEYFVHGSFTIPGIKRQVNQALKKLL